MSGPGPRHIVPAVMHAPPVLSLVNSAQPMPNVLLSEPKAVTQPDGTVEYQQEVLRDAAGAPLPDRRWENGIAYDREQCGSGSVYGMGSAQGVAGDADTMKQTKSADEATKIIRTDPFAVVAEYKGSVFGWEAQDPAGRARRLLANVAPWQIEHEFWTGTKIKARAAQAVAAGDSASFNQDGAAGAGHITQYLANPTTVTTVNGAGLNPDQAVAALQAAMAGVPGDSGPGMIHVPRSFMPYLLSKFLVRRVGNQLLDIYDNIVVPGVGYDGTGPNGVAPASGKGWIYGTGMVRYWLEDYGLVGASMSEVLDRSLNTIEVFAEQLVLVDWDRCSHFAVLVNLVDDI